MFSLKVSVSVCVREGGGGEREVGEKVYKWEISMKLSTIKIHFYKREKV